MEISSNSDLDIISDKYKNIISFFSNGPKHFYSSISPLSTQPLNQVGLHLYQPIPL